MNDFVSNKDSFFYSPERNIFNNLLRRFFGEKREGFYKILGTTMQRLIKLSTNGCKTFRTTCTQGFKASEIKYYTGIPDNA